MFFWRLRTQFLVSLQILFFACLLGAQGQAHAQATQAVEVCTPTSQIRFVSIANEDVANGLLGWNNNDASRTYTDVLGSGVDLRVSFAYQTLTAPIQTVLQTSVNGINVRPGGADWFMDVTAFETGTTTSAELSTFGFALEDFEGGERVNEIITTTAANVVSTLNIQNSADVTSFSEPVSYINGGEGLTGHFPNSGGTDPGKWVSVQFPPGNYHNIRFDMTNAGSLLPVVGFCATQAGEWGDAPQSYGKVRHLITDTNALRLGADIDGEFQADVEGYPANATGDGADDDGLTIPTLTQGETATLVADVTGFGGSLHAWVDWNADGDFEDTGEEIVNSYQDGSDGDTDTTSGTITFDVPVPAGAIAGTTFARFRWSTEPLLDPTELANDGEVEDYAVTIQEPVSVPALQATCPSNPPGFVDFNFTTLTNLTGSGIGRTWTYENAINYLGEEVDIRATLVSISSVGGTPQFPDPSSPDLDSIDNAGSTGNEKANTVMWGFGQNTEGATTDVEIRWDFLDSNGNPIAISTELEFSDIDGPDTDGTGRIESLFFDRAGYDGHSVTSDSTISASSDGITDRFDGTIEASGLDSMAIKLQILNRSRLSWRQRITNFGTGSSGRAGFTINGPPFTVDDCPRFDRSDADDYDEAMHDAFNAFRLGSAIDAEISAIANGDASGDGADDDGITLPALTQGQTATITADVTGAGGFLQGWIDFNGNGTFEAGEQIATDLQDDGTGDDATANDGTLTFDVAVPSDAILAQTFARFRWSTTSGLDTTTAASDGEVEDYAVTIEAATDWDEEALALCPANTTTIPVTIIQNPSFENYDSCPNFSPANTITNATSWTDAHPQGGQLMINDSPACVSNTPAATAVWAPNALPSGIDGVGWLGGHNVGTNAGEGATNTLLSPLLPGDTYVGHFGLTHTNASPYTGTGKLAFFGTDDPTAGSINTTKLTSVNSEALYVTGNSSELLTWDRQTFSLAPTQQWDYLRVEARPGSGTSYIYFDDFQMFECRAGRDFSDTLIDGATAPDGTSTTSYGFASHAIDANLSLGAANTLDVSAVLDADNSSDDGIIVPTLTAGETADIAIAAADITGTGSGTLHGWIDFNGNGSFETTEYASTPFSNGASADLIFSGYGTTAAEGATYARFRLTSDTLTSTTFATAASDGEVEDYAVTIEAAAPSVPTATDVCINQNLPRSGAPDLFWDHNSTVLPERLQANRVPQFISSPVGLASSATTGDGITLTLAGFATTVNGVNAQTANEARALNEFLEVSFQTQPNTISYIENWVTFGTPQIPSFAIDIATQADFSDAVNIFDGAGPTGSNFISHDTVPMALLPGQTYFARFYFYGGSGVYDSLGFDISSCADFGDAENVAQAAHRDPIASGLRLGAIIGDTDELLDGNADADLDDTTGTSDEDGVTVPELTQGETATITADVTGVGGFLQGWIDFNGDGDFADAGEQIATDLQLVSGTTGTINVPIGVPANAATTQTFARFRWSTTSGLNTTDAADDGEVEDYAVTILPGGISVSGTVFNDNGLGGVAHDGVQDASEPGHAGYVVEGVDATGAVIASTVTDGNGEYELILPHTADGTSVIIRAVAQGDAFHVSGNPGTLTDTDTTDGMLTFTPSIGTDYEDLDFGLVFPPTLTQSQSKALQAGSATTLAHTFTALTDVTVDFALANIAQTSADGFTTLLFLDANCNGSLDGAEAPVSGSLTVAAGQTACLGVRVVSAAGLATGSNISFDVTATGSYTGTSETFSLVNTDTVTITGDDALQLTKDVCNVTNSACDPITGAGFADTNAGKPGDALLYRLVFGNTGSEPIDDVTVNDQTPAWTSLSSTAPLVVSTPSGMSCSATTPASPSAGYVGPLAWSCIGDLQPGGEGVVTFEVTVDE